MQSWKSDGSETRVSNRPLVILSFVYQLSHHLSPSLTPLLIIYLHYHLSHYLSPHLSHHSSHHFISSLFSLFLPSQSRTFLILRQMHFHHLYISHNYFVLASCLSIIMKPKSTVAWVVGESTLTLNAYLHEDWDGYIPYSAYSPT